MYQSLVKYGIIYWGNTAHSNKVFVLQKKMIRIMLGVGPTHSCRELFKQRSVGSRMPHRMFVVDLERATASSWYGQDHDRRCTGRNEERGPSLLGGDRAGSSWWPWLDANALVVSWLELVASRYRSVGRFSLVRCTGSTDCLVLRMPVPYALPASWTRPNAARRCYAPCWLTRRQDSRRLALGVKLLCGRFPQCILPIPCVYIFSCMMFVVNNLDNFQPNNSMHGVNTRNKECLHKPFTHLSSFQKGVYYSGVKLFNSLRKNIVDKKHDKII
jgi:hypothetical protein